ncbi:hypothetical protein Bca4012_066048 [Brassica carinata]
MIQLAKMASWIVCMIHFGELDCVYDPTRHFGELDGAFTSNLDVSREDIADILAMANGSDNLFRHQRKIAQSSLDSYTRPPIEASIKFGQRAFDWNGNRKFSGRNKTSMVSTEMSMDMHVLLMEKSSEYHRMISGEFLKELCYLSILASVFQSTQSYSLNPSLNEISTPGQRLTR